MPAKRSRLFGWVLNNAGSKAVAVLLALVTWYAIQDTIRHEKEIANIPIEVLVDQGWAILDRSDSVVSVTFRGAEEAITALTRDKVNATIDLRGEQSTGTDLLSIRPRDVKAPSGVRAVQIEPDSVLVSLDREGDRTVPVKPVVQGELPEGYELGDVVCRPNNVRLIGPRQKLDLIEVVRTAPIDLGNRVSTSRERVALLPPSETWVARVEPESVMVEVEIIERSSRREFPEVVINTVKHAADDRAVALSSTNTAVVLEGRSEVLDILTAESILAYIDCRDYPENSTNPIPVLVRAPPGVVVRSVVPAEVQAIIQ